MTSNFSILKITETPPETEESPVAVLLRATLQSQWPRREACPGNQA